MTKARNQKALGDLSTLVDFSKFINSSLDLRFTLDNLLLTCLSKFHITRGMILIADGAFLKVRATKGFPGNKVFTIPPFNLESYKDDETFKEFLTGHKLTLVKEIRSYDEPRGLLLLGQKLSREPLNKEEAGFLDTIINIASTAIENSLIVDKIKKVNRDLDAKVNQLSSLFDLSKEFSGVLDINRIVKLLVFSVIGQMLVSKYSVLVFDKGTPRILETKIKEEKLLKALEDGSYREISGALSAEEISLNFPSLYQLGIRLVIPMFVKSELRGLILLGNRVAGKEYSRSDIEYLTSVAGLAIISIDNSLLFAETLEKQRMEKDLELARDIQKNLLPDKFPDSAVLQISSYNKSARQVGGDYYDIIRLDDGRIVTAIADVSGKGVQAALLMANLQAFLKSICKQDVPIDEATGMINDLVAENIILGSFITFFWGVFDETKKTFTYVNAGHNPPFLYRNGEVERLKKGGMILGVMETMLPYEYETIELKSGDLLVLFTDGISEAMDAVEEEFGEERILDVIKEASSGDAPVVAKKIIKSIEEFTAGQPQSDDITLVVIKVK